MSFKFAICLIVNSKVRTAGPPPNSKMGPKKNKNTSENPIEEPVEEEAVP